METITKLNQEVMVMLKSEEKNTSKGSGRYRLIDVQGRAYSRLLGWRELDGKIYGHQFAKDEVPLVLEILKKNGFHAIRVEKDTVGSLFSLIGNSPFGNPKIMAELYLITAMLALGAFICVKFNLLDLVIQYMETIQLFK